MRSHRLIATIGMLAILAGQGGAGEIGRVEIANTHVRVVITRTGGRWSEAFEARSGSRWVPL